MDLQLQGKKALVFASSEGLGKACAQALVEEGGQVLINGRNEEKLRQTAGEIGAAGFISGDLTRPGQGKRITEEALEKWGSLDIVITNTGGPSKGDFTDVTVEQWQNDYQSLWLSVVESLKVALPSMEKTGYGRILMITSIAARRPLPGLVTSNGLRAGLEGLAKSLAPQVASSGITINLLLPGYTNTERIKNLNLPTEKVKQMVPMGRLGEACELAHLACFLASARASYITGQSIAIDGGVSIQ